MRLYMQRSLHKVNWPIIIVILLILLYRYCYKAVTFHLGFGNWDLGIQREGPTYVWLPCPLSCAHSSCTMALGPRPAAPGEEGVRSRASRPQEGKAACIPFRGEAGTEALPGKEGPLPQHSASPPPITAGGRE